ncbi:myocardin isoform X2 [Tachyglossus aculeatus]|uniref:myocardin isoform X2 n=1 Tax=Tachyglossus aculeatus TaxID=9261 RepID=UPI0018F34B44|nr:myocardin isoform X2 [Tachyglossus aculeatus]
MTLLGSEHSLLLRSKFRSVLQLRLQQRRTQEQLADQSIMPPLKSPPAFHDQRKSLERGKAEAHLKHKIRARPGCSRVANMHILPDSAVEGSVPATQMKLKRARLADDLNEKIALRPGPLELVEKNIIPVDSAVKEAIKGSHVNFSKPADAFAFEEDSSNDGRSDDSRGSAGSPPDPKAPETPLPAPAGTLQDEPPDPENDKKEGAALALSQPEGLKQGGPLSSPIPVPAVVKAKSSGDSKHRHKKPKDTKPKVKKLKYHQYIPPDQKAEKSPPPMDSAYARLLQQQQLFLQLQILSQQQPQHFAYTGLPQAHLKEPSEQLCRNPSSASSASVVGSTPLSPVKTTFAGPTGISAVKPGPLPANLDDLKVSELRQQLRLRGLPVSGTKTALMDRLRPFQDGGGGPPAGFGEVTTVTFPVTPSGPLPGYPALPSSVLSNGFYHFGSTSSTPPISPASSDLSVGGSLPDAFTDGQLASPQFCLQPSPVHVCAEESLLGGLSAGGGQPEPDGPEAEKDKMLVEKQKVINELTRKLQWEQRQVEELRLQLQKQKRNGGPDEKPPPCFFGVPVKEEDAGASCPFAAKPAPGDGRAGGAEALSTRGPAPPPLRPVGRHADPAGQSGLLSSTFLSPQSSPQDSPLGAVKSPQHISLPPSPNGHYLLALPAQGEGRGGSPQAGGQLRPAQTSGAQEGSPVAFAASQPGLAAPFCGAQAEGGHGRGDASSSKNPALQHKQLTRSQQMDEILDVLIESGEMPANAREDRSCLQKGAPMSRPARPPGPPLPRASSPFAPSPAPLHFDPCAPGSDNHFDVLLNSHSPLGKAGDLALLKMGGEEPQFEGMMDAFPGKAAAELLDPHEVLHAPPSASSSSSSLAEGGGLPGSFTESPWETMEWLDLTPPSSAAGFGSAAAPGPNLFNIDFLDVADLNLNAGMDLHLQQW